MMSRLVLIVSALVAAVNGHGYMDWPPTRNDMVKNGSVVWSTMELWRNFHAHYMYNHGCLIGCDTCTGTHDPGNCEARGAVDVFPVDDDKLCCANPMEPTVNDYAQRTYHNLSFPLRGTPNFDAMKYNPWRAPGWAPVNDPCGIMGGYNHSNYNGHIIGNAGYPPRRPRIKTKEGAFGSKLPKGKVTTVKAGELMEVSFRIMANHGGGYQYRLCSKEDVLNEKCFQKIPLKPEGDSWIAEGGDRTKKTHFKPTRVTEGVFPKGSVWTKNPIAPCEGWQSGGAWSDSCPAPLWKPAHERLWGFGVSSCFGGKDRRQILTCSEKEWDNMYKHHDFSVGDDVRIPAGLKGEYTLAWRWDTEQTPQVWANCADIKIE